MERRKILVVTKTYPSISRKYKETVCTVGVLLDDEDKPLQWIRIYPIRFRYLATGKRYRRWSIISAEIEKNNKDYRKESFRINDSSIKVVREKVNDWSERKSLILPLKFNSVDEMKKQDKSLGIIKPYKINKYFHKATRREWSDRQKAVQLCISQGVKYISQTPLGNTSSNANWIPPNKEDAQKSLSEVAEIANQGTILLLCAEKDWQRCHRVDVANQLEKLVKIPVKHLK